MVGLVLVSHSLALATALKETLRKLYADKAPPIAVAAGAGDHGAALGTDAPAIMAAIEEVGAAGGGVLVLLDLGSAVMSAELALDLLDPAWREKVVLCPAPLVEGAIAAAAQSSIGATLAEVRAEAEGALRQKVEQLGGSPLPEQGQTIPPAHDREPSSPPPLGATFRIENVHGLHARPAMRIVQTAARFASVVEIQNLRTGAPPASARSLVAINCLDARLGDSVRVTARGADAAEALRALDSLHAEQFGDQPENIPAGREDHGNEPTAPDLANDRFPSGRPLSEGVAFGALFFARSQAPELPPPGPVQPEVELARLRDALVSVRRQLEEDAAAVSTRFGRENAAILEAHRMLADDPALVDLAASFIRNDGLPAPHAWQQASRSAAEAYRQLEQPFLRERARDVEDLSLRVLRELGAVAPAKLDLPDTACILAVPTLLPSEIAALDLEKVQGILAESIGPTSHAAILLRGAGVPVVDGVDLARLHRSVAPGAAAALDGATGEVWIEPDEATRRALDARRQQSNALAPSSDDGRPPLPLHTRDGRRVELAANVTTAAEAVAAARNGAEAIGLLRTELLFFDRLEPPTEDEQTDALRRIAAALPAQAPVTVRTFDIGGDKPVPFLPVPPETNPFLGVRGLRLALRRRDLFLVHLRAILRAAHGYRFRVMFPMVTEVEEIRDARALLHEAHAQLTRAGTAHAWPLETGMMVEVPAAALNARAFAPEVDFFSIGTNDLTQYTLAAERGHPQLVGYADALHPAVLRLVAHVAAVAARAGKWTGVCGEAAADPVAAGLLIGLGVQELSVGVGTLGRLRKSVGESSYEQNRRRARQCLRARSSAEVRQMWMETEAAGLRVR